MVGNVAAWRFWNRHGSLYFPKIVNTGRSLSTPRAAASTAGVTTTAPTWADAVAGELVLLLGYPNATSELTATVGRVLTDDEARQTVTRPAGLGDVEGRIAYDAEVELIVQGESVVGMSGGAVIDQDGLIGVLARATDVYEGVQYVRAVRMSWVTSRLAAVLDDLSPADESSIRGYLEPTN